MTTALSANQKAPAKYRRRVPAKKQARGLPETTPGIADGECGSRFRAVRLRRHLPVRLTHQPGRPEITAHPPEDPPFRNDQRQTGCEPDCGRPGICEPLSVKREDNRNRKPGARQAFDIDR